MHRERGWEQRVFFRISGWGMIIQYLRVYNVDSKLEDETKNAHLNLKIPKNHHLESHFQWLKQHKTLTLLSSATRVKIKAMVRHSRGVLKDIWKFPSVWPLNFLLLWGLSVLSEKEGTEHYLFLNIMQLRV